jgi:PAS domain S-box-containing protein
VEIGLLLIESDGPGIIMSIFSTFRNIFIIIVVLFSLVSFSVYKMNVLEKSYRRALVQQTELRELGKRLAQGSDYLTDEIRRYVQFGEQVHYANFWAEVRVTRSRDKAVERLKELKVLPNELVYIEKAKEYSDDLIKTEEKAMGAVERKAFDESRRLVFGKYYDDQKKLIMENIKKFQDIVNARAQALTNHFQEQMSFFMMLTNLLLLLSGTFVLFLVYSIGIRRLLNPLKYLTIIMRELVVGNLDTEIQVSNKKDEMSEMGQALRVFKENLVEKNNAELKLSQANKSRDLILESVGEGIYGLDLNGKATFINPMAEKLTGYSLEEMKDNPVHSLTHHSKPNGAVYSPEDCPVYHTLKSGVVCSITDELFWHKDGTSFPVEYTSTPIYEKGLLAGAVVVFKDVSERKHVDEVMRQIVVGTSAAIGDKFLKSIVKHLATSLRVKYAFIGEFLGDKLENIETLAAWANGELAENFEYSLRGTPCENVVERKLCYYPRKVQEIFPSDQLLVEMGVESYLGVPLFDIEKKCRGLLVVMDDKEILQSLNPKAVLQVFANRIEAELERHQAEVKLEKHLDDLERLVSERTASLERSNQNLSDFAFIASHDLQEPLRKVSIFGDMLKELNKDLGEKSQDCIDRMQNATFRMQTYIDDLLMFSRLTVEHSQFVKTDCNKIIREILLDLEVKINESRGTINVDKFPDIEADPFQIRQLFQNLISNALKYRKEDVDPVVNISSKLNDDGNVDITVEDNGIGFDEKYKDRIFQLFQRLHGKSAYAGTGIGLSICKRIVDHHHGAITVDSSLGEGAIFSVVLPTKQVRISADREPWQ